MLAFKALLAGAVGAASTTVSSKGLASGSYTVWRDDASGVGASQTPVSAATLQDCLVACDLSNTCAGVAVMTDDSTGVGASLTSCSLIKGDSTVGTFKRSMTRVVTSRLTTAIIGARWC